MISAQGTMTRRKGLLTMKANKTTFNPLSEFDRMATNWPIGLHSSEENANLLKHPRLDHPDPERGARQDGYFDVGRGREAWRRKKPSCTTAARLQAEVRVRDPYE